MREQVLQNIAFWSMFKSFCDNLGPNNLANYKDKFIIAAEFSNSTEISIENFTLPFKLPWKQLTSLYNSVPLHSRPLAQNLISNTLLTHLQQGNVANNNISISTHPLPEPKTVRLHLYKNNSFIIYI